MKSKFRLKLTISLRLLLTIMVMSLLPLIIVSSILSQEAYQSLHQESVNHLESIASIQKSRMIDTINSYKATISLISSRTTLRGNFADYIYNPSPELVDSMCRILDDAKEADAAIIQIQLYDPAGFNVASTDRSNIGSYRTHDSCITSGLIDNGIREVSHSEDGTVLFHLSGPLVMDEKTIGVIVIDVSSDSILHMVSDYSGLQDTGETVFALRDENGDALFMHPLRFDVQAAFSHSVLKTATDVPITQALLKNETLIEDAIDYRGESVLAVTRYIDETDWGMVVKIDTAEAFAPYINLRNILIVVNVVALLAIVAVSLYWARRLSKPITNLTDIVLKFAAGGIDTRSSVRSDDEIGILAKAFNQMADSIQKYENSLEKEILDRTIQLRKEIEEKTITEISLKESEERYRTLFESITDAFAIHEIMLDESGKPVDYIFLDVNGAFEIMTGLNREGIIGKRVTEVIPGVENEQADWIEIYGEVVRSGKSVRFEQYSEAFKRTYSVLAFKSGEGRFCTVFQDISERLKAEEKEQRLLALLQASVESPSGMIIVAIDLNFNYLFFNTVHGQSMKLAYNTSIEIGMNILDCITDEDDRERSKANFEKAFSGQSHTTVEEFGEVQRSYYESRYNPIFDAMGNVIGATLFSEDITIQMKVEEEQQKMVKLESIGTLAGGIAHDFNNILTGILGNIGLASIELYNGEIASVEERLKEAEMASFRARDLTHQLLTFARGGQPVKKLISINSLLEQSTNFALRGSSILPVFSISDDLWSVEVDEGQISQVINNIVINAVQAMPDGGELRVNANNLHVSKDIYVGLSKGDYVQVSIQDQGKGISEENLKRIFEPYFTTKQTGSGLGLATSYSIIKNHDGTMSAESVLGQGTTITLFLPASKIKVTEKNEKTIQPSLTGYGKILVMDDEAIIRSLLDRGLTDIGYEVVESRDGNEAIELYKQALQAGQSFDAAIMDLTIPGGMGGKEAVLKLLEIDPDAKVIVSSGYSNDPILSNPRQYGFVGVIPKPFKIDDVHLVLKDIIS